MSIPYVISVMSQDRVGIIADVTHAIKKLHGNLEDMSQTVMRGYFTMILLARFPDGTSAESLHNALLQVKGLSNFHIGIQEFVGDDANPPTTPSDERIYVLTASGPDNPGLVAAVSECLREKDINIVDMTTKVDTIGNYTMMFVVVLPEHSDIGKLKRSLQIALEPKKLTVGLRHQAIFRKTNEI